MNKKAEIMVPEVLKLVIAIICIIGLIYAGTQIYGLISNKKNYEQAKAGMEEINRIIGNLKEGDSNNYLLVGPAGWILFRFDSGNDRVGCVKGECFCLCENEKCESTYYCIPTDRKIMLTQQGVGYTYIKEKLPLNLRISNPGTSYYNIEVSG